MPSQTLLLRCFGHPRVSLLPRGKCFYFQSPQIAEVSDFQRSYHKLRQMVADADEGRVMGNLARYVSNLRWLADEGCMFHGKPGQVQVESEMCS